MIALLRLLIAKDLGLVSGRNRGLSKENMPSQDAGRPLIAAVHSSRRALGQISPVESSTSRISATAWSVSNGRCRMHGGLSPGAPRGNKNAFKHGHYAAEAVANRRELAKLLRNMNAVAKSSVSRD